MAADGDGQGERRGPPSDGRRIGRIPEPRPATESASRSVLLSRHSPKSQFIADVAPGQAPSPRPQERATTAPKPSQVVAPEPPPIDFQALDSIRHELEVELPFDFDLDEKQIRSAPPAQRDPRADLAAGIADRQTPISQPRPQAPPAPEPTQIPARSRPSGSPARNDVPPQQARAVSSKPATRPTSAQATSRAASPRALGPVVPPQSVAGRALMLVVGIMCFLACLSVGALVLVEQAARDWQLDVSREVTLQVKPVDGKPIEPMLQTALDLARATPGVKNVRLMSERDSAGLLEPWLGSGFDYSKLPVPRLILIELSDPTNADLKALVGQLTTAVPSAELDDHSIWSKRLRTMAGTMVAASVVILVLVLTAMVLSVVFATRAAMAGNRDVVQVLHFVGAEDAFVAGEFQHHFLILGFKGGVGGGLAAMLAFLIADWVTDQTQGLPGSDQAHALFGGFQVGLYGYIGAAGIVLLVAGLTALTSRLTVRSYLNQLD